MWRLGEDFAPEFPLYSGRAPELPLDSGQNLASGH